MKLLYLFLLVHVSLVLCSPEHALLQRHFLVNLYEDHREVTDFPLNREIQQNIDNQVNGFTSIINKAVENSRSIKEIKKPRVQRNLNDLLVNERRVNVHLLNGFQERGKIPVNFPKDLCLFKVGNQIYSAGIRYEGFKNETNIRSKNTVLFIFIRKAGKFHKIFEHKSRFMTAMDCQTSVNSAYIAIVNTIIYKNLPDSAQRLDLASLVFKVTGTGNPGDKTKVEIVQKFAEENQSGVKLWTRGANVWLLFTFHTDKFSKPNACGIYKSSEGSAFNLVDQLPCQNARAVEFFTVYHDLFIFLGNHENSARATSTFSFILKLDLNQNRFLMHQKIFTHAVVDGKYFYFDQDHEREHFLLVANEYEVDENSVKNYEISSMVYKFVNGIFAPLQSLNFNHVKNVLPVLGKRQEFLLLVSSSTQELQIYQYDGWKFLESSIDFTGESFGRGVSSMRSYSDINNDTFIVIANQEVSGEAENVFTPIFIKKNDTSKLKNELLDWCSGIHQKIIDSKSSKIKEKMKLVLQNAEGETAKFVGKIHIKNSKIKKIRALNLKSSKVTLTNSTIHRANRIAARAEKLRLREFTINQTIIVMDLQAHDIKKRQIEESALRFDELIIEDSLNVQKINGQFIKDLVYSNHVKNMGKIKAIEAKEVVVLDRMLVQNRIDGVKFTTSNVLLKNQNQQFGSAKINKLTAKSIVVQNSINSVSYPEFQNFLNQKLKKKYRNLLNITVDSLTISSLLNNINVENLVENTLKVQGDQIITGDIKIKEIKTNGVIFVKESFSLLSGVPLNQLVLTNDTTRVIIDQDISFTQDELLIKDLFVAERLNNIKVIDGRLNVLRLNSSEVQVITGDKTFESVKLMNPIKLQGKIKSETLEKMNPLVTVNENLQLEGNFVITGPVSIKRLLKTTDNVFSIDKNLNMQNLLDNGLKIETLETNTPLVFKQVIVVENDLQAPKINDEDTSMFIKTNWKEQQVVTARKFFENGLVVDGNCEAWTINKVKLQMLNDTMLKNVSPITQVVSGTIQFNKISVHHLSTLEKDDNEVFLGERKLSSLLFTNKNQQLDSITLSSPNSQVEAKILQIESFSNRPGNLILGHDFHFLISDSVTSDSLTDDFLFQQQIFIANLTVDQLFFANTNPMKQVIMNYSEIVNQEHVFDGSMNFGHRMKIKNLSFKKINNVTYEDFANSILLKEGRQVFSAPQFFGNLNVDQIKLISHTFNGVNVGRMINESIWIDQDHYLGKVEFAEELLTQRKVIVPLVNGLDLETQLIVNGSMQTQVINKLIVNGDCNTFALTFNIINDIDVFKLKFPGDNANLKIYGNAFFAVQPNLIFLNENELKALHEGSWLANRETELRGSNIMFANGTIFEGSLELNRLNNLNLHELAHTYFSLSLPQEISSVLYLDTGVFRNVVNVNQIKVLGLLKTSLSDKGLNISHFNAVMLKGSEEQVITGKWKIEKLFIDGDFEALINNLYLRNDVVHEYNKDIALVTGRKSFINVKTRNINTEYINDVRLSNWFLNSVYLNKSFNQIIQGKVTLVQPVFFDDIQVQGLVNNIYFSNKTILTKSHEQQVLTGNVYIKTKFPQKNIILPLSFIKMDISQSINYINVNNFFSNILKSKDFDINSKLLTFEQPLEVNSIETMENRVYAVKMSDFLKRMDQSKEQINHEKNLLRLKSVGKHLLESFEDEAYILSHFEHQQSIVASQFVTILSSVPLNVQINGTSFSFLAVSGICFNQTKSILQFYKWNRAAHQFEMDPFMRSFDQPIVQIKTLKYHNTDVLMLELFENAINLYTQFLYGFSEQVQDFVVWNTFTSSISRQFVSLDQFNNTCCGSFTPGLKNFDIICDDHSQTVTVQTISPIQMVTTSNQLMILLFVDRHIEIWFDLKVVQSLGIQNPVCLATIHWKQKYYLAVCSDRVDDSVHYGSIEIYESSIDKIEFMHIQSIKDKIPSKTEFSILPSSDLLLYVLTNNPIQSLMVYRFNGINNFNETVVTSTTTTNGIDMRPIKIDHDLEMLSIISKNNEVVLIEAVMKKY